MGNALFWISKETCTKDNSDFRKTKQNRTGYFFPQQVKGRGSGFWLPRGSWESIKLNLMLSEHMGRDKSGLSQQGIQEEDLGQFQSLL